LATSFLISFLNRSGRNRGACACKGCQHGNNTWSFIVAACQLKLLLIILYNLPILGKILQAVHLVPNTPDSITWKLTMMDDIRKKKAYNMQSAISTDKHISVLAVTQFPF
jgi:hypothetical protein